MTSLALFFVSILTFAAHAETVNLRFEDLPKLVTERNDHWRGAQELATAAQARTGSFARSYLPKIEAHVGKERFETGTQEARTEPYGAVEAKINVFNSGRDSLEEKIRREESLAARATASDAFRGELAKARRVYWQLVAQNELIRIYQSAAQDTERNLTAALQRIKAGLATGVDRLEFEMAKVEVEQDLARAQLEKENLERDLRSLLAWPTGTVIQTSETIEHQHEDLVVAPGFDPQQSPAIQAEQVQSKVADLERQKLSREWLPRVDVIGSRSLHTFREREFADQEERWESVVGVQVEMKLFDGWEGPNEARAQKLRAEGLRRQARQSASELESAFIRAKNSLELSHKQLHGFEDTVAKGRQYFSRILEEYRRGTKNSIDVLGASQKFFDLQKRYTDLKKEYQLARVDLLGMVGE